MFCVIRCASESFASHPQQTKRKEAKILLLTNDGCESGTRAGLLSVLPWNSLCYKATRWWNSNTPLNCMQWYYMKDTETRNSKSCRRCLRRVRCCCVLDETKQDVKATTTERVALSVDGKRTQAQTQREQYELSESWNTRTRFQ